MFVHFSVIISQNGIKFRKKFKNTRQLALLSYLLSQESWSFLILLIPLIWNLKILRTHLISTWKYEREVSSAYICMNIYMYRVVYTQLFMVYKRFSIWFLDLYGLHYNLRQLHWSREVSSANTHSVCIFPANIDMLKRLYTVHKW